jgi:hypothetical protein
MPNLDWNAIVRFAPLTNPIPTMAIYMKTSIRMAIASVAPPGIFPASWIGERAPQTLL